MHAYDKVLECDKEQDDLESRQRFYFVEADKLFVRRSI
jgi:hypothetical protein